MDNYRFIVQRSGQFENEEVAKRFALEMSKALKVRFHDEDITVIYSKAVAPGIYMDSAPVSK